MVGRRPKPTALKLVEGNRGKRPINRAEPKPKRGIPECPAHLDDAAKGAWVMLTALLDRMGILTEADGPALERLCDCYSDILECRKLIAANGRTYKTTTAQGDTLIKSNPACSQLRAADAQFKSYLVEFGLTPAARTKIHAVPADNDKYDPCAEFFG